MIGLSSQDAEMAETDSTSAVRSMPLSIPVRDRHLVRTFMPLVGRPGITERTAMVFVFMILIAARLPNVALHGRVWAEEGAVFLRNAAVYRGPRRYSIRLAGT